MALAASAATESFSPLTKTCLRERAPDQVDRRSPLVPLRCWHPPRRSYGVILMPMPTGRGWPKLLGNSVIP